MNKANESELADEKGQLVNNIEDDAIDRSNLKARHRQEPKKLPENILMCFTLERRVVFMER